MAPWLLRRAGVATSDHQHARRAGRMAAAEAASRVGRERARTVLLVSSGNHASATAEVAQGAREHLPQATVAAFGSPSAVASGEQSSERPVVCALALASRMSVAVVSEDTAPGTSTEHGWALGSALKGAESSPYFLFGQPRTLQPGLLDAFERAVRPQALAGCIVDASCALACTGPDQPTETGAAMALRIDGLRLGVGQIQGVRRLTDWLPIDDVERGYVTRLSGRSALQQLTEATQTRSGRPLVLAVVEQRRGGREGEEPRLVRRITGVDPTRGGLHIGWDVERGDRVAFAVRERGAMRAELDGVLRDIPRRTAGGNPVAGLFIAGPTRRGRLTDPPRGEVRAIRDRIDELPLTAVRSAVQLVPTADGARLVSNAGALAMLYAPN